MDIKVKQNNKFGSNNINQSIKENTTVHNRIIWGARAQGIFGGIILSIIANFIYDLIK